MATTTISTITPSSDDVSATTLAYREMQKLWVKPRALMGGTAAMRAATTTYLPKEAGESQAEYENRVARSFLFNAFKKTISNVTSKVFSRPMVLNDDVPEMIKGRGETRNKPYVGGWAENIDLAGRNIDVFAADVFSDGVQTGISHILVDMQAPMRLVDANGVERLPTLAEERQANRRPYFVHVKAENLIGWRSENISGREVLTQIRIKECVSVPDGEFGEVLVDRVRVLEPNRYRVYQKKSEGIQWEIIEEGPVTLGFIPLATFYAKRTGFMTAEPPLIDLADLNIAHWQSSSDQRHILHFARVPILFGAGLDTDNGLTEIGSNRMLTAQDAGASLQVVEHTGAAIAAGRQDLLDLEDKMRMMGLEIMTPRSGDVTATASSIDAAEAHSTVKQMALAFQDAVEQALGFMANWAGKAGDAGGSVTVNTDFGISLMNASDIDQLIKAKAMGDISRETFWDELKRRGFLQDDFDPDEETIRLEDEMATSIETAQSMMANNSNDGTDQTTTNDGNRISDQQQNETAA